MTPEALFSAALQLGEGWEVKECRFEGAPRQLKLKIDFQRGKKFPCAQCGKESSIHDTEIKQWRHLNFFQYECLLEARIPRSKCESHGIRQVGVPWARKGSGFTLLFEAMTMLLSQEMPIKAVAEILQEQDTRLWRIAAHYVEGAHAKENWGNIKYISVDETSSRRGHRYVTNIMDTESHKLLLMEEGRSGEALKAFKKELEAHRGRAEQIELISMDMSPAYQKGAREYFPQAQIVFDRFHIMQMAGEAVDKIRKELVREGAELKKSLWAIRGNEWTRSEKEQNQRRDRIKLYPKLGRAIGLRDMLQDILATEDTDSLRYWCKRAKLSKLQSFKELAITIQNHWDGVVAFLKTRITNGAIEAVNGLLQLAKRLARGFRSLRYFRIVAYLKAAKLSLPLPSLLPT